MHACVTTIITDKCCMLSIGRENNGELASAPAFLLPYGLELRLALVATQLHGLDIRELEKNEKSLAKSTRSGPVY